MDAAKLTELKLFIDHCKSNPSILYDPSLSFFREYLESLGAKLPTAAHQQSDSKSKSYVVEESDEEMEDNEGGQMSVIEEEVEIIESDIELEGQTVEPDNDPPQKMGDRSVEATDENREAAQGAKAKAIEAISEGKLEEAIEHLTEAILMNPTSAIMYATRASVYVKMLKPNAAIRDANAALEINPDSAKGYKSRGMAHAMLGHWEEAAKDLHLASRIDYDEEISAVLKKVKPNAHKIEEHRRKYDRLHKEREDRKIERERSRRRAEAKAADEKAKNQEQSSSSRKPGGMPTGFTGGMPGGFPGTIPRGAPGNVDFSKVLNDPELMAAFSDPDVSALQDGGGNCDVYIKTKMVNKVLLRILDNNILTGSNFKDWLKNLRIVLDFEKIAYVLDAVIPLELDSTASWNEREVFKKWHEDNRRARSYMLASMNKELQIKYENVASAYDIFIGLQELYSENLRVVEYKLCTSLFSMRLKEGLPLNDHIIKMINHMRQLEVYGMVIPDRLKVNLILQSLPASYKSFIINYNVNRIEQTIPVLLNELQEFYRQNNKGEGNEDVHMASASRTSKKSWKPQKKGQNVYLKKNFKKVQAKAEKVKAKVKEKCFYCGKEGHWKRNCLRYLDSIKKAKEGNIK